MNDEITGGITCLSCTQTTRDQVTLHRMCTGGVELKLWDQLPSSMVKKRARLVTCFFATNLDCAESSSSKKTKQRELTSPLHVDSTRIHQNCSY